MYNCKKNLVQDRM